VDALLRQLELENLAAAQQEVRGFDRGCYAACCLACIAVC
jgi:hypothetical protein